MSKSSRPKVPKSVRLPKRHEGQRSNHDAMTQLEEATVWLTALKYYSEDELTQPEIEFLHVVTRNLARIHQRLQKNV